MPRATIQGSDPPLTQLPDTEFVRELDRRHSGIPAEVAMYPEFMQLFLPILRADLTMIERYGYKHSAPLNCPISVFSGHDDASVDESHMRGWHEHTRGPFSLTMMVGDHFYLRANPDPVLEILGQTLA